MVHAHLKIIIVKKKCFESREIFTITTPLSTLTVYYLRVKFVSYVILILLLNSQSCIRVRKTNRA